MKKKNLENFLKISLLLFSSVIIIAGCGGGDSKTTAKDSAAKTAAQKSGPGTPIIYDSSKRYIYLTWDDSPQPPGTVICKQIFHEMGVKATFFAVGMHQFDHLRKTLVDSIRNSYPEFLLANHSYSHGFRNNYKMFYSHPDSAVADFMRAEKELKVPVKIIRFPGNNTWVGKDEVKGPASTLKVAHLLDSLKYCTIGWDIEWRFGAKSAPIQSADEMI
ncbi:MAG TPA: polysaccharide deacetylase family protein, partial [Chitinophagaceae bacterium]|nr:polysaccharide deacetylase family protein [Chitinophagaceae bacterium]